MQLFHAVVGAIAEVPEFAAGYKIQFLVGELVAALFREGEHILGGLALTRLLHLLGGQVFEFHVGSSVESTSLYILRKHIAKRAAGVWMSSGRRREAGNELPSSIERNTGSIIQGGQSQRMLVIQ